jgi:hypothetical protein
MSSIDIIRDSLGRVHELVPAVLEGMDATDLNWRPDTDANPMGWLVWHLCRVEDGHLSEFGGHEQVWTAGGWQARFGLPYPAESGGFGQDSQQVGQFSASSELLTGYAAAVAEQTNRILDGLAEADLGRIVDRRWDPPVTVAVRLVSVVLDTAQHIGQVAYLKGLRERAKGVDSGWQGYA